MEFAASESQLSQIEGANAAADAQQRLELTLELAWQLRQRDTRRAQQLASEASVLLVELDLPQQHHRRYGLYLTLIRAEIAWLFGRIAEALRLSSIALAGFVELDLPEPAADTHFLRAWITSDQSQIEARDAELAGMLAMALRCDPVRVAVAKATIARHAAFADAARAKEDWLVSVQQQLADVPAAAACWRDFYFATQAAQLGEYDAAIGYLLSVHEQAQASGQVRLAIYALAEIGSAFVHLNEYHTALEWLQRGMELVHACDWDVPRGMVLYRTAAAMYRLSRSDVARTLLQEALTLLEPINGSRAYAFALHHLGELELAGGDHRYALNTFEKVDQLATRLGQSVLNALAMRGLAQTLSAMGQGEQALQAAQAAMEQDQLPTHEKILTLKVLAEIQVRHNLRPSSGQPLDGTIAQGALDYLLQALELANSIPGYTVSDGLLDRIASEYARLGQHQRAFTYAKQANLAREQSHGQRALRRVRAIQSNYQSARLRIASRHHRQMAEAEAARATALQQTGLRLERLSRIGQLIGGQLQEQAIFATLQQHLPDLLPFDGMVIWRCEPDATLQPVFVLGQGWQEAERALVQEAKNLVASRAASERRVMALQGQRPAAGELALPSQLFVTLCPEQQVTGVVWIGARRPQAYGNAEQSIFAGLCACVAIALANASAHAELAEAHRQLQQIGQQQLLQEKMAGLGTLAAGVAHEINNPTNFVHVAAQNLSVDLAGFADFLRQQVEQDGSEGGAGAEANADARAILAVFEQRFADLNGHIQTMLNGTARIKAIVQDLRRFTRSDSGQQKQLQLSGCLHSAINLVRATWLEQVDFATDFGVDPPLSCWPALLNQAFMNLLVNGCQAIALRLAESPFGPRGQVRVCLREQSGQLLVEFHDNGVGIAEDRQANLLQAIASGPGDKPVFSRQVRSASDNDSVGGGENSGMDHAIGLGLAITLAIVQQHQGSLSFVSKPGQGSCFTISLPLAV